MTKTKTRIRPVWHETHAVDTSTGRAICVAESGTQLLIRLKGTRGVLSIPYTMIHLRACMLKVSIDTLQKANAKRRRKSAGVSRGRLR